MTAAFAPPGPGQWALDRSHFAGGTTPICQWLMEESMGRGMRRVFAELGVPDDALEARFVNGFMYTRLRPLIRPDHASAKLPAKPILRIVTHLHPAFRRRAKAAATAFRTRPWVEVSQRWATQLKPAVIAENRRLQATDPEALADGALGRHVAELLNHCRDQAELHFWLHGHYLGPIARTSTPSRDGASLRLTRCRPSPGPRRRRPIRSACWSASAPCSRRRARLPPRSTTSRPSRRRRRQCSTTT